LKTLVQLRYLAGFFLEWGMFWAKFVGKNKTQILCSVTFFFSENRAVHNTIWKNVVAPDRPQMTIWRMRISRWVPKATNTLSICNTYFFFAATMVTRKPFNTALHLHCLSFILIFPKNSLNKHFIFFANLISTYKFVCPPYYSIINSMWIRITSMGSSGVTFVPNFFRIRPMVLQTKHTERRNHLCMRSCFAHHAKNACKYNQGGRNVFGKISGRLHPVEGHSQPPSWECSL